MNKNAKILRKVLSVSLAAVLTVGGTTIALPALTDGQYGLVANATEVGEGFYYRISYGRAEVTGIVDNTKKDVVIPDTLGGYPVYYIYANAFAGNTNIETVEIPSSVGLLCDSAFAGCTSLRKVTILSTDYSMNWYVFKNCTSLESINLDYCTGIGREAFANCTSLRNVTIPDTISELYNYTFKGSGVRHLKLPEHFQKLSNGVFNDCTSLETIEIPSMTDFSYDSFNNCHNVRSVILGDGVTYVPSDFLPDNPNLTHLELGSNIVEISNRAFEGSGLTSVTFPDSVQKIGYCSFAGSSDLEEVKMSDKMIDIDATAFNDTPLLGDGTEPIYFGNKFYKYEGTNSSLTIKDGTKYIVCEALSDNETIKSVTLPNGIVGIGHHAFSNCEKLNNVVIPEGVTDIGLGAFVCCDSLTDITAPNSLLHVGEGVLQNTPWYDGKSGDIYFGKVLLHADETKTRVLLTAGTVAIADNAFGCCSDLKSVRFSNSLKVIGASAFAGLQELKEISLPANLTEVGQFAFSYTGIKSVTLPDKLKTIGMGAFDSAEEIVLSPKMTVIPDGAFAWNVSLKKVNIPEGVTKIGAQAFFCCPEVEEINLPSTLKEIGDEAFMDASKIGQIIDYGEAYEDRSDEVRGTYPLKSVYVPANVKKIGERAIGYCQYGTLYDFRLYGEKGSAAQTYANANNIIFNDDYSVVITNPYDIKDYYLTNPTLVFELSELYGTNYTVKYKRDTAKNWTTAGTGDGTSIRFTKPGPFIISIETGSGAHEFYTGIAQTKDITNTTTLSADKVKPGTKVTVNAGAEGGTGLYGYQYRYKKSTAKGWSSPMAELTEDMFYGIDEEIFAKQSSFSFKPKNPGIYEVVVNAGDVITKSTDEKTLQVAVYSDKEFANKSTISATSVNAGTKVKLTGAAEGGTETFTYSYYYKRSTSSAWKLIGTESTTSTSASFKPTSAGSFDVMIVAEDGDGSKIEKTFTVEVK